MLVFLKVFTVSPLFSTEWSKNTNLDSFKDYQNYANLDTILTNIDSLNDSFTKLQQGAADLSATFVNSN